MRRELAIKVDYLEQLYQEQYPAAEQPASARALGDRRERDSWKRAPFSFRDRVANTDHRGNVYLSARGGFGQYLRRAITFPDLRPGKRLPSRTPTH